LQLGFSGSLQCIHRTPSYGLFTVVLTKKLGGYRIPLLIAITFIFGIGTGLLAEYLTLLF
jgi:hypothetical protein